MEETVSFSDPGVVGNWTARGKENEGRRTVVQNIKCIHKQQGGKFRPDIRYIRGTKMKHQYQYLCCIEHRNILFIIFITIGRTDGNKKLILDIVSAQHGKHHGS